MPTGFMNLSFHTADAAQQEVPRQLEALGPGAAAIGPMIVVILIGRTGELVLNLSGQAAVGLVQPVHDGDSDRSCPARDAGGR